MNRLKSWMVFVFLLCFFPFLAFAQDAAAAEPTMLGRALIGVYILIGLGVVALMGFVANFFAKKAKEKNYFVVIAKVWEVVQSTVAWTQANLRPDVEKALADGKVTKEEWKTLLDKAVALAKQQLGEQGIKELKSVIPGDVGAYLAGVIERALLDHKVQTTAATAKAPPVP